jgi:hypothetical protein
MTMPVETNTPLQPPPAWTGTVTASEQLANAGHMTGYTKSGALITAGQTTSKTVDVITDASMETQLVLVVDITAVTGGETLTIQVNGKTASGVTYPILTSAALGAVAVTSLRVGMAFTAVANLSANDMLPSDMQVVCTVAGGGTIAYGVDVVIG